LLEKLDEEEEIDFDVRDHKIRSVGIFSKKIEKHDEKI
jgi:hypothetical protein